MCRKIEYPEQRKFKGKLCTLYMYGMSGLAKKLNVQNCVNSTGKCTLRVRNVWVSEKIECPKLRKFNRKLCTLYMYGMSRLAKKLKVKNCIN